MPMNPYRDIKAIKDQHCILDLFIRDGHLMKRSGPNYFCLCPFHEEKTPSCCVSTDRQSFRCFGCNIGGDLIRYWQRSRQCDFYTTLTQLASLADTSSTDFPLSYQKPKTRPDQIQCLPEPLSTKELSTWATSSQRLLSLTKKSQRVADWRNFSPELIAWAAQQRLIGLYNYGDLGRIAFAVKAYTPYSKHLQTVSIHIRLNQHTPMNATANPTWRYHPTGKGSWPFVIGDPAQASDIFITEGQWDALALCELMQWGHRNPIPRHICIIGMRGASASWNLFLKHYPLNSTQRAFIIIHSDKAGKNWLAPESYVPRLTSIIPATYVFAPDTENSDLNQRLKENIDKTHLLQDFPIFPPSASQKTLASLMSAPDAS